MGGISARESAFVHHCSNRSMISYDWRCGLHMLMKVHRGKKRKEAAETILLSSIPNRPHAI
eukprot:scaffold150591_cov31-Tisochrysis_lutea.AAC.1